MAAAELGKLFWAPQKQVWLPEAGLLEKQKGGFSGPEPLNGAHQHGRLWSSAPGRGFPTGGGELDRVGTVSVGGVLVQHLGQDVGGFAWWGRAPSLPPGLVSYSQAPPHVPHRLTFLLAPLTPQACPPSSKAPLGGALIPPSVDSFPRPQGLRISPPSTGRCPPAVSSRSCTGHWPPSTGRTGEARPLAQRPAHQTVQVSLMARTCAVTRGPGWLGTPLSLS